MTTYRTCVGCIDEKHDCASRDRLRKHLKGLGVTSIKWKCAMRVDRVNVGDPVWALTVASTTDNDGEPYRDHFPAMAIRHCGSKMLVFIEPGSLGRNEECKFDATHSGFCKIPLSRISARDGEREDICKSCQWPASKGHAPGYICAGPVSLMEAS